ncbi:MAG TPA: NUDIX domain-containing protein [Candidatus Saccharimonadales bacterium]|nr:NUDIX domain-containing protein [Candidatus Saccharimonadales bacterium]
MENYEKDWYFVAVKVFLRDGDRLLVLHDKYGSWDIPGGRIRPEDFETPLEEIIDRKMGEELGPDVKYSAPKPNNIFFRVERLEAGLGRKVRIFAVGYEAQYQGGKIALGKYMERYEWVDVNTFKPEDTFKGGWLKGVQEYLAKVRVTEEK